MFFSRVAVRYIRRVPRRRNHHWTFVVNPRDNALILYTIGPCRS
jgi:hypothetical protein